MEYNLERPTTIGIVGDGQLAKMLYEASADIKNLSVLILSTNPKAPACKVAPVLIAKKIDEESLIHFFEQCHYITFENEFFLTSEMMDLFESTLYKIQNNENQAPVFFPNYTLLHFLSDRKSQKNLFEEYNIPTSPSVKIKELTGEDLNKKELNLLFKNRDKIVAKKRLGGYDGYGTFILTKENTIEFLKNNNTSDFIFEEFISFKRELAVSFVKSKNQFVNLPVVESYQRNNQCFWVKGPYTDFHVTSYKAIEEAFKNLTNKLNYSGILAVELFETETGELIVNEIAPRVHNSAHYSIEGLSQSQFLLHLVAGLNLELKKPNVTSPFCMINLLGTCEEKPIITKPKQTFLHWYDKLANRPKRKMGHITALGSSTKDAYTKACEDLKEFKL